MTTTEQRKDITERLRNAAEVEGDTSPGYGTMLVEAADEIDILRLMFQCAQDERDAARAEVQCLRAELKETAL